MDGWITIGTKLDTKNFDSQIQDLERKIADDEDQLSLTGKYSLSSEDRQKVEKELEQYKNKLVDLKQKKQNLAQTPLDNTDKIKSGISSISDGISGIIKKVARWALAVFSVRSAYNLVKQASSTLGQYDKQYATNLEYIRFALAQAIAPILYSIVSLVFKLMTYINYVSKALFGVDLFSNASAKNFQKMSSSATNIKKTLQSTNFDEMNVLSDTTDTSTSGAYAPSIDLSKMQDVEIPDWLKKITDLLKPVVEWFQQIIDKYGPVAGGIMIVVGAIAGFMILKTIIKLFTSVGKAVTGVSADFTGFLNSLGKAVEFIALLGGLTLVINAITELIDTFAQSGLDLGEALGLVAGTIGMLVLSFTAMMGVMTMMQPSWQSIAGATVIFLGLTAVLLSVSKLLDSFAKSGLTAGDAIGLLVTVMVSIVALMGAVALLGPLMTAGLLPFIVVVAGISAILLVMSATLPTILSAVSDFITKTAPSLINIITAISQAIALVVLALGTTLPPIINSLGNLFNGIFTGIARIVDSAGNAVKGILDGISGVIRQIGNTITQVAQTIIWFINALGPAINNFVDNTIRAITKLVNFVVSAVEYLVNRAVDAINGIANVINAIPGVNIGRKSYVSIPRFYPQLAVGGIVNMPGKGVPIGGAITGEAGQEGVIPLTDQQAMETLGNAIGRYITINANITNNMNGRVLSRAIEQIKGNQDFAYNA